MKVNDCFRKYIHLFETKLFEAKIDFNNNPTKFEVVMQVEITEQEREEICSIVMTNEEALQLANKLIEKVRSNMAKNPSRTT